VPEDTVPDDGAAVTVHEPLETSVQDPV
jgi:hypothetical protein